MTISLAHPIAIPVSAILAPQDPPVPSQPLPSPSAALLGPLPPTTPFHLALNWLALSDIPEYESTLDALTSTGLGAPLTDKLSGRPDQHQVTMSEAASGAPKGGRSSRRIRKRPARALIITARKDDLYHALQEEDEDWMRDHGSDYGVVARLKRVDIRYCPTPQHAQLLLSLLTSQPRGDDGSRAPPADAMSSFSLDSPPGLIILYDVASLFMEWQGRDENAELEGVSEQGQEDGDGKPQLRLRHHVKLSDYLDLIAASRSAVDHVSSLRQHKTQLVLLEPNLTDSSTLPVLASATQGDGENMAPLPTNIRQKRIKIADGLRWILGNEAMGTISAYDTIAEDIHAPSFEVKLASEPDFTAYIKRRRCGRGEWARSNPGEGDVAGDQGGWRWEWC